MAGWGWREQAGGAMAAPLPRIAVTLVQAELDPQVGLSVKYKLSLITSAG